MADQIIRPADLPTERSTPVPSEWMVVDNGVTVAKSHISDVVISGRPTATQAESIAGVNILNAMTPLTTKQSIASEVGVSVASKAQGDLAATAVQPGDLSTVATTGAYADLSGKPALGTAAATDASAYATAGQGTKADSALQSIHAGTNVLVDATDPRNPVISASGGPGGGIPDRVALKALNTAAVTSALLTEAGRQGQFVWSVGNYSTQIASDPQEAIYVKADAIAATVGAWVRLFDGVQVRDTWFGVARGSIGATSGPDMRAYLQAALDFCRANACDLLLTKGSAFVGQNSTNPFCLLNEGVSMIGVAARSTYSVIAPMPSVPSTVDIIRFRPRVNQDQDYITFTRFMVNPTQSGTKYGKRAFHFLTDLTCNIGQFLFTRMYCGAGNDYSLYFENAIGVNFQGNPSNASISESSFFEGIYLTGVGDNISVRDNFIISSPGSALFGVYAYQVDGGGGVASFLDIQRNAMNSNNCAIIVDRARNLRIRDNNIEHSVGSPTNATVINLRGSGGTLSMPIVSGNAIGIFGSSTAQIGVNSQSCYFPQIRENNIITDVVRSHAIAIGGTVNARVANNKVSPEWTNNILDGGTGTIASDFVESGV